MKNKMGGKGYDGGHDCQNVVHEEGLNGILTSLFGDGNND